MAQYKLVIADTTNSALSKMSSVVAQAIGAGFGYPNVRLVPTTDEVLVFDPNKKSIGLVMRDAQSLRSGVMAVSADYLVHSLTHLVLDEVRFCSGDGVHDVTVWEDTITFRSTKSKLVGTVTVPKDLVRKALGEKTTSGLPIVQFHYPDGGATFKTTLNRTVKVTHLDKNYLIGMELSRGGQANYEPTLKKYKRERMGDITFVEFIRN